MLEHLPEWQARLAIRLGSGQTDIGQGLVTQVAQLSTGMQATPEVRPAMTLAGLPTAVCRGHCRNSASCSSRYLVDDAHGPVLLMALMGNQNAPIRKAMTDSKNLY
jgi:hypothetical protein